MPGVVGGAVGGGPQRWFGFLSLVFAIDVMIARSPWLV